jgi:hypothetical protein
LIIPLLLKQSSFLKKLFENAKEGKIHAREHDTKSKRIYLPDFAARKGIKIFPLKDLFRKLHLRPSSGKNFESWLHFFFTKIYKRKRLLFSCEKKQKSYQPMR